MWTVVCVCVGASVVPDTRIVLSTSSVGGKVELLYYKRDIISINCLYLLGNVIPHFHTTIQYPLSLSFFYISTYTTHYTTLGHHGDPLLFILWAFFSRIFSSNDTLISSKYFLTAKFIKYYIFT